MAIKTQDEIVTIFETVRDRMTGAEIDMVQVRLKEYDELVEGKSDVKYQNEVLTELDTILTGIVTHE